MDIEKEKNNKPLDLQEAREQLAEAWFDFWSSTRTSHDSEIRNRRIHEVLERLSPAGKEYFLHEEGGGDSELAKIREGSKGLVSTRRENAHSRGEKLHVRRQKAAKRGIDPKRIR